jgi:hypothetical protein
VLAKRVGKDQQKRTKKTKKEAIAFLVLLPGPALSEFTGWGWGMTNPQNSGL